MNVMHYPVLVTALQTERPTYDQWLQKRKEEEGKLASVAEQEEMKMSELMSETRPQWQSEQKFKMREL